MTRLELELNHITKREEWLNRTLANVGDDYDFVVIDCNPIISTLNRNILAYAEVVHLICETHPYSLNGLKLMMEDLYQYFHLMKFNDKVLNIVPNKYEDRSSNSAEAMSVLRKYYSDYVRQDFAIRKSEDFLNGAKLLKPLPFFARKNANATEDMNEFVRYLINLSV